MRRTFWNSNDNQGHRDNEDLYEAHRLFVRAAMRVRSELDEKADHQS